jgi:hypothetical protein
VAIELRSRGSRWWVFPEACPGLRSGTNRLKKEGNQASLPASILSRGSGQVG